MNANREPMHDESDETLDRMIRALAAQPAPVESRDRVLAKALAFTLGAQARRWRMRARPGLVAASATAALIAACVMGLLLMPSPSVGWDDVARAIQTQKWMLATTRLDPGGGHSSMWISPQRQVWAFARNDNWFIFMDGRQQAKFEYRAIKKQITKTAMSEEDRRLISPVDYMSQGLWLFGTEKAISQTRREIKEDGKKWVEFDLLFGRGDMKLGTLRVDPATRLPVYLLFRSSTDATKTATYDFTYPDDGPADIFALGAPAGAMIDDRMPSKEALRVLDAVAASRARIGDFRMIVTSSPRQGDPDNGHSLIIWRKGDRWRIDKCMPEAQGGAPVKPPDSLGWDDPAIEKLKLSWLGQLYVCDGQTVYMNENSRSLFSRGPQPAARDTKAAAWKAADTAPRELLAGDGDRSLTLAPNVNFASLVYPDLSPRPGWGFQFDARSSAVPGCVLIKRSASLATKEPQVGHEWYYLDPTKGYAVVQAELFNVPADAPADPKSAKRLQTIRLEDFKQAPQGFWYPSVVHSTAAYFATVTYHFDFGVALPDQLFTIEKGSKAEK